jgi:Tfp pilus assembly pilus retraction ATPase PilT
MIQRQQEIMTRMLESEKAEKQREQDKKREADQAKEKNQTAPPDFSPYFKQKQKETELLQTIPAELQPYYKLKAKEYFNKISGN